MNWKSFLLGVGIGVASGIATKELMSKNTTISPEKALAHAKALFKKEGPISGSWIQMKPEPFTKQQLSYKVYKGGISRNIKGTVEQFEFISDATTGTIIDAYRLV